MKKSFFLTLLLTLCCTLTAWAQFNPTSGVKYALREMTSGLYLDIQTLGIHEPDYETNSISLSTRPCIIYFEAGNDSKWRMKNVKGTYASNFTSGRDWNTSISSTPYDWKIETGSNGLTIAKDASNYIGWDKKKAITAGSALYNNAEGVNKEATRIYFTLVEYSDLNRNYCVLKSPSGTYLNFTPHSNLGTAVTFQETASELYITPSANTFYLQGKSEANKEKYVGSTHDWNTTTDFSLWTIAESEEMGLVHIKRNGDNSQYLGTNEQATSGTGIFTNVPLVDNGAKLVPWQILETIDYATKSTVVNNKCSFTSDRIWYTAPCNTLRFTLTESVGKFQNGTNRMSLDEFKLYDANDKEVELKTSYITGNNNKTYEGMLDEVNNKYAGTATWNDGKEDDWFEITLPSGVDLGGAFSFSFVTENETMNAKAFRIELSYKKLEKNYTFTLNVPGGKEASVTYNGKTVEGTLTVTGSIDPELIAATDLSGYTWNVVIDDVNGTVAINYTSAAVEMNPSAVVALVKRIGGENAASKFKFVLDPSMNSKQETFVLGATENNEILIKGTTISAITTGLGWYLNNIAHINIAWNSLNEKTVSGAAYADLTNLPLPQTTETHTSDAKYRYYLNYCTFGYSMTSWTWKRWQQEIDWMALHGINMPLQIVGLEEVWRKFLTMKDASGKSKYNYSAEEAKAFVAGPAFTAWWGMNNLEGWGGTGTDGWGGVQDDAWYARQKDLATKIVTAQRALGMQPVLPGFSGMVPSNFGTKNNIVTNNNGGSWSGFTRPHIVSPTSDRFAGIAADYYACLKEVMGESQYYSMDPFHEGGGSASDGDYTIIYNAMEAAKPGSQWVIQQWQWYGNSQKKSLTDVPAGKLIVLDLFSDGRPEFDSYGYNGYAPQEAVFCAIPNFGGRSGLMGRLQNVTDNYFTNKAKHKTIKGIGTAPEAIEQTPVTYDLIYQLPWMNGVKPDVAEWVANYAVARYGKDNAVVKEAWSLLRQGPLGYGADAIQGPVEDVWAARPNLDATPASSWGTTLNSAGGTYTKEKRQMLIDAVYKLIDQQDELALTAGSVYESNYLYDLVEFGGAVMADYAYDLLKGIATAKGTDATLYEARKNAFLQLILDMDEFRGTNLNFRLGKWTQEARDAAKEAKDYGATIANEDWYEFNNARTILTTWGDQGQNGNGAWNDGLKDYSYRSWQGLLKDYYYPRWKYYFDNGCTHPKDNAKNYFYFEWNWAHGMTHQVGDTQKSTTRLAEGDNGYSYSRNPEGNTLEAAKTMLQKYIIPVKMNNGTTYYAYRTFTTDLTDKATVTVPAGATVDFTQFFDVSAGATVTGNFLNGAESAAIKAVPVTGTVGDTYAGTITLTDGTVLSNFTVKVEQGVLVAGYYHIYWQKSTTESTTKTPIFIGYNTDNYDNNIEGYKMLAEGQYTTDASADKVFALIPKGNGFALSAQGKYLQSPIFNEWKHIMFSDEESKAGVYVFTANNGAYTIKGLGGTDGQKNHLQVYDNNDQGKYAVGNNVEGSAHQFTLTPVTTYEIAEGMTALCLPFNVILPTDVVAYDVVNATEETLKSPKNLFVKLATGGDILLAGTPVILKANAATSLTITMNSERGKTSSNGSLLRGNFVKQTLKIEATKKYILQGGEFIAVTPGNNIISANSCWVVTDIPDENASLEQDHIVIDGWEFKYTEKAEGRITLGDCIKEGNPTLNIGSEYVVNGEKKTVAAISRDFLEGNTTLQSITLPATMTNLGFRETELMFEGGYAGESGDGATYDGNQLVGTAVGLNRCYKFPDDPTTGEPYVVGKETAWKLTLDVTIDPTKKTSYNNYGSAIVSTKQNSLDDNYQGYMQIYMWQDLQHIVVRIDNADDRYAYSTPALDEQGNETSELLVMNSFRFELEHDGSGGYQVVIYYPNGKAKMYNITATQNNIVNNFDRLYYSLPEGISVKVKFEKLTTHGLFVGCTNLTDINVDPANPTFKSCKHGVLYDKNGYYVMRIPEGGTDRYEIPSKVVKLYPGAVHGVKANVVLHSNPEIGVVKGHEEEIKNVNFELSLDDIDPERSEGGAYDFNTSNLNTYKSARYRRAPLAEGAYGTITLPFASTNMMDKYDFYQFVGGSDEALHFTQVETLEANTPYLYKLKEGVDATTVTDVFETAYPFTIVYKDKYYPNEAPGTYNAVGTYTNFYVETNQAATSKSAYYYYSIGSKAFLKVTQKLNYRPYRAFFVVTPANGLAAQAPATLSLRLLDGSTEVIAPSQVEGWEENIYYDLMGRRVMNPTNGIYIVNGKKVIF